VLSARHIEKGKTSCSAKGMAFDSFQGRKIMQNSEYIQRIVLEKPELVIAMGDEIPFTSTEKRHEKSTERTTQWFKELKMSQQIDWDKTFLFGVVIGG